MLTLWFHPKGPLPRGWTTWAVRILTRSQITHVAPEILGCQLNLTMKPFACKAYWAQKAALHRLWPPLYGIRLEGSSSIEQNLGMLDLVLTGELDGAIPNLLRYLGRKLGLPIRRSLNCVSTTNVALVMAGLPHLQGNTPSEIASNAAAYGTRVAPCSN